MDSGGGIEEIVLLRQRRRPAGGFQIRPRVENQSDASSRQALQSLISVLVKTDVVIMGVGVKQLGHDRWAPGRA